MHAAAGNVGIGDTIEKLATNSHLKGCALAATRRIDIADVRGRRLLGADGEGEEDGKGRWQEEGV